MYTTLYIVLILIGLFGIVYSFQLNKEKTNQIITSIISGVIFLLCGLQMFTNDLNIYTGDYTYTTNSGWFGTLLVIIGAIMTLYTIILIYQIFIGRNVSDYKGHG